jgi:hypothetical protein
MSSRRRRLRPNRPPSFTERTPLPLVEFPPPPELARVLVPGVNDHLRTYRLGECSVIVTKEYGQWHLSIAHRARRPSWDEVAEARYRILPDGVTMAMLLPPMRDYLNIHENCYQLVQVDSVEMVGGST